jgi:hypothetical protein
MENSNRSSTLADSDWIVITKQSSRTSAMELPAIESQDKNRYASVFGGGPMVDFDLPKRNRISRGAILDSHYTVFKKGYREEQFEPHRGWLTLTTKDTSAFGGSQSEDIPFYTETKDTFTVPRYYGLARWGVVDPENNRTNPGIPIDAPFEGNLLPKQSEVCSQVLEQFTKPGKMPGAILRCPCGFGKTVCAIYIGCKLGLKFIFTVVNVENMDNFTDEMATFAPSVRVGRVHQNLCQVDGYDVVVAVIQTVLSRDYGKELFQDFGLWIMDEMHHIAAPSFSKMIAKIHARNYLGLSATPRRSNGLTPFLFWSFGPLIECVEKNYDQVICRMIKYTEGEEKEIVYKNGRIGMAEMVTNLAKDPNRNHFIVRMCVQALLNPYPKPVRRKFLVLSNRLSQLGYEKKTKRRKNEETIFDWDDFDRTNSLYYRFLRYMLKVYKHESNVRIDESILNRTRILSGGEGTSEPEKELFSIGFFVGSMTREERFNAKACTVILATYSEAKEQVNIPAVDTVVFAASTSDPEQSSGRGLRFHPNKNVPMMIYIADMFSIFEKQAYKVAKYFKNQKFTVQWEPKQNKTKTTVIHPSNTLDQFFVRNQ